MFKELVNKNRSYRRFYEDIKIENETLVDLINTARNIPSTANSQSLKFVIVNSEETNEKIFETLAWAGRLKDWKGPEKGERPSAYIVILCELSLACNRLYDEGIAAQTIMLAAAEKGLGGCMLGSIDKKKIASILELDSEKYSVDLVLALGKPKEKVVLIDAPESGDIAYFRDADSVHYVPKRKIDELIIGIK